MWYARIGGTLISLIGTPAFSSGTPTFRQMGVLNSWFQNPSERSEHQLPVVLNYQYLH